MKTKNFFSISAWFLLNFCMFVLLSACSSNRGFSLATIESPSQNKTAPISKKPDAEQLEHNHPSNPCTVALAHFHLYDVQKASKHKHSYDCENTNEFVRNAHIHPPSSKARKYRHVHPNGVNKHSHNR